MMIAVIAIATVAVLLAWGVMMNRSQDRKLRAAPNGATRIEVLKSAHVRGKVSQYQRAGWRPVDQSSAKSLGSQARVTITFRKG